jgi:hypothetical protein
MLVFVAEVSIETSDHLRHFWIDLDQGERLHYRSRVSFEAFRSYKVERCKNKEKGLWYIELDHTRCCYNPKYPDIYRYDCEIIELNSVWEFYDVIGYNYKTKKYNNDQR